MNWRRIAELKYLIIAPILAFVALSAWALASPVGSSPDDDHHLVSIWCSTDAAAGYCTPADEANERMVPEALVESTCFTRDPEKSGRCVDRYLDDPAQTVATDRGNFNGGYPPIYYSAMSPFVSNDIVGSVLVMRLLNVALFVVLATALFVLLPVARREAFAWGWLVSTVPLGLFIIASNNPSSWTVIGVGIGWLALLGWFESTGRRKIGLGVLFGIATIMAAGSRADGAVYAVLGVAVACVIAFRANRRFWLDAILPAVFIAVCALSVLSSRQSMSAVGGFSHEPTVPGVEPPSLIPLFASNLLNVPSIWAGTLGTWSLGWFDTVLPAVVGFGSIACFVAVGFVGFGSLSLRKAIAIAGIGVVIIVLPVWVLTQGHDAVGVEVQPRYILPAIVMLAGVLVLTAGARRFALTRGQLLMVTITLSVIQLVALHTDIRRYVTGTDEPGFNLNADLNWWWNIPISPMAVLVIGSLAYAGLVVILAFGLSGARAKRAALAGVAP